MKLLKFILPTAVVVAILCTFAFAISPSGKQAYYLWQQKRISNRVLPANTVIYTEDPARIAVLDRSNYRPKREQKNFPEAWERVRSVGAFSAWHGNPTNSFDRYQVNDTFNFLRTSTNGVEWIVHLSQVNPFPASQKRRKVSLTQSSFRPAGRQPGDRAIIVSLMSEQVLLQASDIFTLFAPQPDVHNVSRTVVPYELNGQAGILDAIVTDQGYVQFSVRSGPALLVKWDSF